MRNAALVLVLSAGAVFAYRTWAHERGDKSKAALAQQDANDTRAEEDEHAALMPSSGTRPTLRAPIAAAINPATSDAPVPNIPLGHAELPPPPADVRRGYASPIENSGPPADEHLAAVVGDSLKHLREGGKLPADYVIGDARCYASGCIATVSFNAGGDQNGSGQSLLNAVKGQYDGEITITPEESSGGGMSSRTLIMHE